MSYLQPLRISLTAILLSVAGVAQEPAPGPTQRMELEDTSAHWIAVCFMEEDAADASAQVLASDLGLTVLEAVPFSPRGTRLLRLATARGLENRERLLDAAVARDDVRFAAPVWTGMEGEFAFPTPHLHVRFSEDVPEVDQRAILGGIRGITVVEQHFASLSECWRLACADKNGVRILRDAALLRARPGVLWAEPDHARTMHSDARPEPHAPLLPNDPLFQCQWGLRNLGSTSVATCGYNAGGVADRDMDVDLAWDVTTGSSSIVVAVLDNGVQYNHPDLHLSSQGTDFTDFPGTNGNPVASCDDHGTWMAGIITGIINNGIGIAGVAPGCRVVSVRISSDTCGSGSFMDSWLINGITYAWLIGARVTNSSFSVFGSNLQPISDAYIFTRGAGVLHFASSGNFGWDTSVQYPAVIDEVLAVAAVTAAGNELLSNSTGPQMFCTAPGHRIHTTDRTGSAGAVPGDYTFISETSPACAMASGVGALLLSLAPAMPLDELEQVMASTCQDWFNFGYDERYGWGELNARAALDVIANDYVFVDWSAPAGGNGSGTAPFQTVSQAAAVAGNGDTIVIYAGTYDESGTLTLTQDVDLLPNGGAVVIR